MAYDEFPVSVQYVFPLLLFLSSTQCAWLLMHSFTLSCGGIIVAQ